MSNIIQTLFFYARIGAVIAALWVLFDAHRQHVRYRVIAGWVLGCLLLWVVFFPLYLMHRREYVTLGRASEQADRDYWAAKSAATYSAGVARAAADTRLVCPHCRNIGAVQTEQFQIIDGDYGRFIYKLDRLTGASTECYEDFAPGVSGLVTRAHCGTCLSTWTI